MDIITNVYLTNTASLSLYPLQIMPLIVFHENRRKLSFKCSPVISKRVNQIVVLTITTAGLIMIICSTY